MTVSTGCPSRSTSPTSCSRSSRSWRSTRRTRPTGCSSSGPAPCAADVLIARWAMCQSPALHDRRGRMPLTIDATDLLPTTLQIVELNEKDAADVLQLLGAYAVRPGDGPGTIGLARFGEILGDDWGWWRTATGNLEGIRSLATGDGGSLVPPEPPFDPVEQLGALLTEAERVPKSRRWRLRSLIGERVRWYE